MPVYFWFTILLELALIRTSECTRPQSQVLELNDRFLEVKDEGQWFVEFYAPWCGHCKRLHPTWEQLGHALTGTGIKVGRLDCTRYGNVASKMDIHGFPTIKFFRNGTVYEYQGDRTKPALLDFAWKTSGPSVRFVNGSSDAFQKSVYNPHYVGGFFLLVADQDCAGDLKNEYYQVAQSQFTKAYFFHVQHSSLPKNVTVSPDSPAVLVFKDNGYSTYSPGSSDGMTLDEWCSGERWNLFPEITQGNLYDMVHSTNKLLVMIVSDLVQRTKVGSGARKLEDVARETARKYYKTLHPHVQFGWLDGAELANSIALTSMPIPSILVFNGSTSQFYLPQDSPEHMTLESLNLFLNEIIAGKLKPFGGNSFIQRLRRAGFEIYTTVYVSLHHKLTRYHSLQTFAAIVPACLLISLCSQFAYSAYLLGFCLSSATPFVLLILAMKGRSIFMILTKLYVAVVLYRQSANYKQQIAMGVYLASFRNIFLFVSFFLLPTFYIIEDEHEKVE